MLVCTRDASEEQAHKGCGVLFSDLHLFCTGKAGGTAALFFAAFSLAGWKGSRRARSVLSASQGSVQTSEANQLSAEVAKAIRKQAGSCVACALLASDRLRRNEFEAKQRLSSGVKGPLSNLSVSGVWGNPAFCCRVKWTAAGWLESLVFCARARRERERALLPCFASTFQGG